MILTAGLGSRLRPLTSQLPKPLVPIMNQPLLWHLIMHVKAAGIHEIALNLHYCGERIRNWLGDGGHLGVDVTYSEEAELLGSAGAVRRIHDFFGNEPALIIHGDILFDVDLAAVIQYHLSRSAQATLVLHPAYQRYNYGTIRVNAQGEIAQFVNQPAPWVSGPLSETVFTGMQIIAPEIVDAIPAGCVASLTTDVYPSLLTNSSRFYGYLMHGYWSDIGTPRRYWETNMDAVSRRVLLACDRPQGEITRRISSPGRGLMAGAVYPPVAFHTDIGLPDNTAIGPEVIAAEGCELAEDVRIVQSVLWPRVRVGRGVTIEHSIVMNDVTIPDGSHLVGKIVSRKEVTDL
jgi:mannose-1-phosphate guanylyltransferase/phosphomannomutase